MKILFINLPFSGHVIPTLGLVGELVKLNVQVTYLLTDKWKDKITEAGAVFAPYENHRTLSVQMKNAYDAADKLAMGADLIVYEQFFFLGKHLADKYNKPVVRIFTSFVTNDTLMKDYIHSGGALSIFRFRWVCRKWTEEVARGIPLKTDCWLDEIIRNPAPFNLVYTMKEFQPFADEFPEDRFKFIGASIYARNDSSFMQIPQNKYPLIYISLGTIVNKAISFYKKCIRAFKAERKPLWTSEYESARADMWYKVERNSLSTSEFKSAEADMGYKNVTIILSIGNLVKREALGPIPENFHIYSFVPQLEVLKAADLFITHGGLNSVTEALYFGVPMLVIPFTADQPVNADQIERLHIGKKLSYKGISSESLRSTALSIAGDVEIRENIVRIKEKMRAVGGNPYGADQIIKYYNKVSEK